MVMLSEVPPTDLPLQLCDDPTQQNRDLDVGKGTELDQQRSETTSSLICSIFEEMFHHILILSQC